MKISRQRRRAAERKQGLRNGTRFAAGAALAFGAALVPEVAQAATFTVTSTNDSGSGSLREAVAQTNAAAGADTIDFTVSGTITLTTGELLITESLTIDGPGSASLTISGNNNSRIFNITDGSAALLDVTLDGMTLTGGAAPGAWGGAIQSLENLTITDAVITGNSADSGGGLYQAQGSFTLTSVSVTSNQATTRGGLVCSNAPTVTWSNIRITGNEATLFEGGAALSSIGTLLIEDSTIAGNEAPVVGGLVVFDGSLTAPATIRRTTISGNTVGDWAGGIRFGATTATIENSTISGNTAGTDTGGTYRGGGGLYIGSDSDITLRHSTIAGNTAGLTGGNVLLYDADSSLTIENSIVAGGAAPDDPDIKIRNGGMVTANYSLIEMPPAGLGGANNSTGIDPQLGLLQDNGGVTDTRLPASTSPVINAGNPSFVGPPSTDQHGLARVADGTIDMGAVEVQTILSLSSATYSVSENGGTLTVTVNRTGGSAGATQVAYSTSDGTATGADYDASAGTLNWADGDTAAKTFDVTIVNDAVFEGSQTFNVTLSSPGTGATLGTSSAVVTITDNETQPTISIGNVTQFEGDSGTSNFTFPVTLSGPSAETITVNFATANGSADEPGDYTAASGTLTFNPEVTSQNAVVTVNGDTTNESDETFTVGLNSPVNAAIVNGTGTGTIQADDAPFTVTNTNDSGTGSLRNAIASANAVAGADTITFAVTGTITLTSGELAITESVTIDGPGSADLTISGNDSSRIFNIDDSNAALRNVSIDGLKLTSGAAVGNDGGAIRSRENLTLTDCVVHDNVAGNGGGIDHTTGSIALTNVVVSENSAVSNGGINVHENASASATFSSVRVVDNTASFFTGGIGLFSVGTVVIEDSTISGNTAPRGGGLVLQYADEVSPAIIRRTTVSGNTATTSDTGGIFAPGTDLTLENATISGNSAAENGGGLYFYGATITLRNSTLTGNSAGTAGGNLLHNGGAALVVENSIIANGAAPADPDIHFLNAGNSVTSNYSLIETPPPALTGSNNITGVDPQLGTLQDNGGSTLTHMPAGTSPVINAGDPSFAAPPSTDQRGSARVANTIIDMGSVEVQNILSLSSATYSVGENGGTLTITVNRTGSSGALSVNYATSNGTAAGADYTSASGTLNWADGDSAAKTFDVTILDDNVFENSETFDLTLSSLTGEAVLGISSAVATITDEDTTLGVPQLFSATTASASQVNLSWDAVTGATGYEIFRATSLNSGYSLLTATSNTSHNDTTVSANTTYLYKVRAIGAGLTTSDFSSVDAATTMDFTDPTLSSAIQVDATHVTQLRTAVDAMRTAANLSAAVFTDPTITAGSTQMKRLHITELRSALDAARTAIGLPALSYTDPTITAGSTAIKAAHVTELRDGTK